MTSASPPVPPAEEETVVVPRMRKLRLAEQGDRTDLAGDLTAARAAVGRLRAEVAGLLQQLERLEGDPDRTVSLPPPATRPAPAAPVRPDPSAQPTAIVPRPAPVRPQPQAPTRRPQAPMPVARPVAQPVARPVARPIAQAIVRPTPPRLPAPKPAPAPAAKPAPAPAAKAAPGGLEAGYAAVLAEVLGVPQVAPTSNFFDDLGADSMVMARFCAKVRNRPDLPNVAIKDIYQAPTVAALAAAGGAKVVQAAAVATGTHALPVSVVGPGRPSPTPADLDPATVKLALALLNEPAAPVAAPKRVGTLGYLLCGTLQLLFLLGYPALVSYAFAVGAQWVLTAATPLDIYVRSTEVAGGLFLGTALLPIAVKWLLVGRWKATQFPVWSLRYYRFWLVKTMIRTNPLVRFVGTPLYPFYLRLLGAKIGKGVTILSPTVPVATDLLTIGAGTIIRKASSFTGYRAHNGMIETGRVTIGAGALVGEATVLDVGSSIGDHAQLGHTSALHAGQSIPAGQRWHGSPAEPTSVDYRAVPTVGGSALRRFAYSVVQLVTLFGVVLPLGIGGLALLVREVPQVQTLLVDYETAAGNVPLYLDVLILSSTIFVGALLLGLLVITIVPRVLALLVRPDRVHRLYGISYWALRTITRLSNSKFATRVFGDSSYIVGYLRAIGYKFGRVEQTGSNFGTAVAHDVPFLCHVGSGTVVADGLTMLNTDYSSSAFVASPVRIGARSFFGNAIFYPARARVGDNVLLATKVMVPVDGPVRQNVGLLGSPSFVIPRGVDRDARLALGPEQRRRGVAVKARHNLLSIALMLLSRWVYLTLFVLLFRVALDLHPTFGPAAIAVLGAAELVLTFGYFILLDAAVRWMAAHEPQGVSIYDRTFWRHERYWKVAEDSYFTLLNGTPLKGAMWRALGVRVGRRLYDDGCMMTERKFVTLGDNCMLNERSVVQCHSQENDAFKSDRVTIGSGVTVGVGAFVHYGTQLGDASVLEADSFLMKGEEMPANTRWGGNPAIELIPTRAH
ncbi:Pls/PosA family non-ribosomal peptide synthetase [Pseudonocardia sp. CA-107938]|uniref:Pls/PosA family non-ribosomal peptide synthetase n=1 Tax=Pseudonocardia sp. CA-107938 TaxID=3240021 RepID=UPI003D94A152